MTTGATGQLGLALPVQGELSGTWGDTVNNGITQYTNIAIAGTLTLTGDGAVTLANTTGDASASNITSTLAGAGTVTAQFAIVRVTGTLTVAKVVTGPSYSKTYTVVNAATGGIVTFKASGQTGVSVAVGESAFVYFNGTDYVKLVGTATAGAAGGSNTQVQFNNSGILAGSANMTFNGTTLTVNDLTDSSLTATRVVFAGTAGNLTDSANLTWNGTSLSATQIDITAQGTLRLQDTTGGEYVALRAPASLAGNYTLTFPADDGTSGQALITDGSGVLSWSTAASGDVYGPASATDNALARFDGTTGKLIKDSANFTFSGTSASITGTSAGASVTQLTLRNNDDTASTAARLALQPTTTSGRGGYIEAINSGASGQPSSMVFAVNSAAATATERMRLTTTGLGIGVTAPDTKLQVGDTSDVAIAMSNSSSVTSGNRGSLSMFNSGNSTVGLIRFGAVTDNVGTDIQFYTRPAAGSLAQTMTLDSSGNLGVGTTSPSTYGKFVVANTGGQNFISMVDTANGNIYGRLVYDNNYFSYKPNSGTAAFTVDPSGNFGIGTIASAKLELYSTADANFGEKIYHNSSALGTNRFPQLEFSQTPTAQSYENKVILRQQNSSTFGNYPCLAVITNSASAGEVTRMFLDGFSGYVGIGTTNPNKLLSLSTSDTSNSVTGAAGLQIVNTSASAAGRMTSVTFGGRATTNYPFAAIAGILTDDLTQEQAGDLAFYTKSTTTAVNPTERMRITNAGDVGIGTSSPQAKLDVRDVNKIVDGIGNVFFATTDSQAADLGATLSLGGAYVGASVYPFAAIAGRKANSTSTNASGYLAMYTTNSSNTIVERARIDSSGNFIVGGTTAINSLAGRGNITINGSSTAILNFGVGSVEKGYIYYDGTELSMFNVTNNALVFGTNATGRMRIDSSGYVGIGTSSPATYGAFAVRKAVTTADTTNCSASFSDAANSTFDIGHETNIVRLNAQGSALAFNAGSSERVRISAAGNFLVGNSTGSGKLYVEQSANTINTFMFASNASYTDGVLDIEAARNTTNSSYNFIQCAVYGVAYRFYVRDSGNVQNTNNSYGAISDVKLKENIVDASPKLANLMQVKVRQYNFKSDQTHKQIGVIAQELEQIFPAMIEESLDKDMKGNDLGTTTKSVKYSVFVPMLIKAMQEQQAIIESLKARLDAANL
jgi:hypothetical protein